MLPWSGELAGRLNEHVTDSVRLRDNPLGDPVGRPRWVHVSLGYDGGSRQRFPSVYVLQGYTGHLSMWRNRTSFRYPFPETADVVFATGDAPPAVMVFADAWTTYGGSQFVDSPGTGRYLSYLCEEVRSFVDARYRTPPDRVHRAINGKSCGGDFVSQNRADRLLKRVRNVRASLEPWKDTPAVKQLDDQLYGSELRSSA